VGAGPVGLTLALDLGRRGVPVVVLNRLDFVAAGSKAICFSKRTLDIWHRLGVGEAMVEKGVAWNCGKVFWGDSVEPVFSFDLAAVKQQRMPGFINLQQYHAEDILLRALEACPLVEIRWGHEVAAVDPREDGVGVSATVQGGAQYRLDTDWLIACDGSRSPVRHMLGLDFEGRVFEDNFLIADIRIDVERPAERWFWFDPPFNPDQSALYHRQPDNVWRLDFQLGWNIDREACVRPENVEPLIRAMLGDDVQFQPEWYSVYTFQCRRMRRFLHGRVVFAGDSAHLVSPFGARGCNGGVADADNLAWKLDLVLKGAAPAELLESYDHEAVVTADENILNSSRSTDFMSPKTKAAAALRDAVLELARDHAFARPFVNSGRLSTAVRYPHSPLSTPDVEGEQWDGELAPGAPTLDAPIQGGFLLDLLGGEFVILSDGAFAGCDGVRVLDLGEIGDPQGLVRLRYDLRPGSAYLIRPDQYVAARWREPEGLAIAQALGRATGASSCP
jgi:3-(3-hydroxy-phenyl)propionate hydroxylase